MTYLEAKYRSLGGWRLLALLLNVVVFVGGLWALYLTGFFTKSWYNQEKVIVCIFIVITSGISFVFIANPVNAENIGDEGRSLFSLWWKRKKLEHISKIKELEKK